MTDIGSLTFEEVIKANFGAAVGQNIIDALNAGLAANESSYALKKRLVKMLSLVDGESTDIEKNKIKAATKLDAYWVWVVFGIPAPGNQNP
jgi:hypothetical protein